MYTIEEIKNMTPAEVAAANRKLARKIIIRKLVIPIGIAAAVGVAAHIIEKKFTTPAVED